MQFIISVHSAAKYNTHEIWIDFMFKWDIQNKSRGKSQESWILFTLP